MDFVILHTKGLDTQTLKSLSFYVRHGEHFFLSKHKGQDFDPKHLDQRPYIPKNEIQLIEIHLKNYFHNTSTFQKLTPEQQGHKLAQLSAINTHLLFTDPLSQEYMNEAQLLTQNLQTYLDTHSKLFQLMQVLHNDPYQSAHALSTAAYMIMLSKQTGLFSTQEIMELGLAAYLHDIGKALIEPKIFYKKTPLQSHEWVEVKRHPSLGADILRRHRKLPAVCAVFAEQHHEALDGSGYPYRLTQNELHPQIPLLLLADSFSALTCEQEHAQAQSTFAALQQLRDHVGTRFGSQLFKDFVPIFLDQKKSA